MENLGTTNFILGILAVVSVLEFLMLIGAGIAGLLVYRRVMSLVKDLEAHHVAPAMVRVNAIMDDVKRVTATIRTETERVDDAIHNTINRVDHTVDRVRGTVRNRTSRIVGLVRGARVALESILTSRAA